MEGVKEIVDFYTQKLEKEGCVAAIQIGSSLRLKEKEFFENSDIDFFCDIQKENKEVV